MAVNILLKRSATASKRPVGASMAFGELNLNYDAATGGLYYKNSAGGVVKVGPCQVSATAPNVAPAGSAGNSAGEFWYDTSTDTLKIYDGTSWVESGGSVDSVTGTAPITVDNTDPLNPIVGVDAASTTAPGVVQLNNTTSSTSTTEALTANQGYVLQQQIDALVTTSNLTLAGTYNANTGLVDNVTAAGTAAGFVNGSALPAPAPGNSEYFVIVDVEGSTGPSGTPPYHVGDWFLSDGTTWLFLNVGLQPAYATTSSAGVVQLATDAEVQAGVNTDHAVVPSSLQSKISDSTSTTSSTTIASSTAAKTAYDAGIQGQTDAAAAQADADQALLDAAAAQADADQAILDAAAAQATADQAILDAAAAQSAADNAQTDATQALSDAAAAQATADAAMPRAGGTFTGDVTVDNLAVLRVEGVSYFGAETFFQSGSSPTFESGSTANFQGDTVFFPTSTLQFVSGSTITGDITIDGASTLNSNAVSNFDNQLNLLSGGTASFEAGSSVTVDGSFTFNTAPTFPAGIDIGAAAQVTYDNAVSGLAADNVQDAIDEIVAEYVPNASFTAAGDLLVGSGAGTYAALPAGAADYILASDGLGGLSWVPQSEGDVTGVTGTAPITVDNTDPQNPIIGVDAASTSAAGVVQLADSVSSTSDTQAATANAVKTAYDAAAAAQGDADQALFDAAAAQATADAALPKAGGTMTGDITFSGAGNGIVFQDASSVEAISNSVATTSSIVAASSTAVKIAYDAAVAAASAGDVSGIASNTVIFVNSTDGNDTTGQRGTTKAFLTITAALAVALNGDTIFLSPGSFVENVTLTKGVNLVGTYNEQGMSEGTSIQGNFVYDMVNPVATSNPTLNHIRFISTNTSNAFKVLNNSFGSGGIGTINDCAFVQAGDSSTTEFCFETAGTWTRSLYIRRATFDGNVKHAAGTAAGASGYVVFDDILGTGSAVRHYNISTGTVEFRRPSNALSPVLQTGGVALFADCISGISPSNATTSPIFGGTNISYKGSAASVGTGTVYFNGYAPISGVINVGANLIYGWSALNVTPANLLISGSAVAYTTAVPAAAAVVTASQQRPRFDLLTATSSVAAANQLATVVDSTNGTFYTVNALDAGVF